DELESNGKAGGRETAGYRDRGHSRETGRGGVGAATEKAPSRFLLARDGRGVEADRRGRMRRRGGEEEIEPSQSLQHLFADERSGARGPGEGARGTRPAAASPHHIPRRVWRARACAGPPPPSRRGP